MMVTAKEKDKIANRFMYCGAGVYAIAMSCAILGNKRESRALATVGIASFGVATYLYGVGVGIKSIN